MKRLTLASLLALLLTSPLFAQGEFFRCTVEASTATTIQAVGGDCAASPGTSLYITDIVTGSTVISSTSADAMPTLKYGTGTTCGTGTVIVWLAQILANTTVVDNQITPIRIPDGNDLCWINSPGGTKHWVIAGYKAP
jgi:hypothetical protein